MANIKVDFKNSGINDRSIMLYKYRIEDMKKITNYIIMPRKKKNF